MVVLIGLLAAGCSTPVSGRTGLCASVDPGGTDALARVCRSGSITVATRWGDDPRSWYDSASASWNGFDVDVAEEIAARLGVTARIERLGPSPEGSDGTGGPSDMVVASIEPTREGRRSYLFTPPYYYDPASIVVPADNTSIQDPATDLDGKRICVAKGSTSESYLRGTLTQPIAAPPLSYVVEDPDIVRVATETDAIAAVSMKGASPCDAALASLDTIARSIARGAPVRIVGDPLFYEPFAIAFDRSDPSGQRRLVDAVSGAVQDMHADGTLAALSEKWFDDADLSTVTSTAG